MAGYRTVSRCTLATAVLLGLVSSGLVGCESAERATWERALGGADQDTSLVNMGYVGPVEHVGPGAICRQRPENDGYALTRTTENPPVPATAIKAGPWFTLSGDTPGSGAVSHGGTHALVMSRIGGLDTNLAPDLANAQTATLTVDAWRVVELDPLAFATWFDGLPDEDDYRQSVLRKNRLVTSSVVEVRGMTAEFQLDTPTANRLRAALADGRQTTSARSNLGVPLTISWATDTRLRLIAEEPFYVFNGMSRYKPDPTGPGLLLPVEVQRNAPMMYEVFE